MALVCQMDPQSRPIKSCFSPITSRQLSAEGWASSATAPPLPDRQLDTTAVVNEWLSGTSSISCRCFVTVCADFCRINFCWYYSTPGCIKYITRVTNEDSSPYFKRKTVVHLSTLYTLSYQCCVFQPFIFMCSVYIVTPEHSQVTTNHKVKDW